MNQSHVIGANSELYVWIYPESCVEPVQCGVLELVGGRLCRFEYARAWLASAGAYELSPDLPLRPGKFEPDVGLGIHSIWCSVRPRWRDGAGISKAH